MNGHDDYCDSDWASCVDDERFISGYYIFIEDNLISWKSKKHSVVARSTIEIKYRAMVLRVTEM
jgi:hypothetical protein